MDLTDAGWKSSVLTLLARIILGGGVPILVFGCITDPSRISLFLLALAFLAPMAPAAIRIWPVPLRGALSIAALIGIGSVCSYYYGPVPGSLLVFAGGSVLATLLGGRTVGLIAVAASSGLFLMLGWAGRAVSAATMSTELLRPTTWIRMAATTAVAATIILLIVDTALRRLGASLDQAREALAQAQQQQSERERAEHNLRESEEQRREQAAAVEAAHMKTAFLANMAHEIRTPLNAVVGFTHLSLQTELTGKQREYLTGIRSAGQALLEVINDVLDLSKIEAGRLTLESIPFPLDGVLQRVRDLLSTRAAEKAVALRVQAAPGIPRLLRGDPTRLGQVLLNLASNGLKFTRQGEVVVAVSIGDRDASGISLCFRVRDTGIGMSEDQVSRLFEPFIQADDSVNRIYGGTGLGLAISGRIVQQMGASIRVESAPGQGSTFSFVVRLAVVGGPSATPAPERALSPRPLTGARLLLVEDVDINRQIAREILESAGATVEDASDGLEATRRFDEGGPFAAIIMDVQMPAMDGYQATALIRKHPRGADIPIIGLSAHGIEEERERCLAAGMSAFVTKPVDPDRLVAAIAERLSPLVAT